MEKKKIILIVAVVGTFIVLAFFSALNESMQNTTNETNINNQTQAEETTTEEYITSYKWNQEDTKEYKNYYYVNAGIEDEPIIQKYVELRVETEKGDIKSGDYKFETDNTTGASFTIFISQEKIEDFNTTEVREELITPTSPYETKLEKGQYVYILQGFNNKGIMKITKQ